MDEICANCEFWVRPVCPCPLKYVLPLAVNAVETVEERERNLENQRRAMLQEAAWVQRQSLESASNSQIQRTLGLVARRFLGFDAVLFEQSIQRAATDAEGLGGASLVAP